MFGFRKKISEEKNGPEAVPEKKGLFQRLRAGLAKTGQVLGGDLKSLFQRRIDADLFTELEERLLLADVGIEATQRIMEQITRAVKRGELNDAEALFRALEKAMVDILEPVQQPLAYRQDDVGPFAVLVVGVNGAGKTTTIGKIAHRLKADGQSVLLAAGDTFRAAAVEQLQAWGQRIGVPVIAQATGADPASVVFDALQAARARGVDVMLADTAGRLHTQHNLMEEIRKVRRVMGRLDPSAPHEVLLVIDGSTGQNALHQVRQFHEALGVTGLIVTKLDGTARGGVLFALAEQFGIPVRMIGVGEQPEDLQEFDARNFVAALLAREENTGQKD